MDLRKARLRVTKWATWLLIAVATGGAWVFYFADAPTLLVDLFTLNAHPVAYTTIAILTGDDLLLRRVRARADLHLCLPVAAHPGGDDGRGHADASATANGAASARGKHSARSRRRELGDCIDCMACVNVCPMGIDIRDGQQLECITCALCIDACDEVMERSASRAG